MRLLPLIALLLFAGQPANAEDKPNILLVFMDNFGWGEPGFNGGGIIRGAATPALDQLAAEGLRLTNFPTLAKFAGGRVPADRRH